jgi:hypothetical protein
MTDMVATTRDRYVPRHAAPTRATGLAAAVVLVYLGVATFPGTFDAVAPGLDPGWVWAINHIPGTAFRFGHDVIFTYGPLGYLITPLPLGSNLFQAAALWVLSQGAMLAMVVYHYRRNRSLLAAVAFATGFLLALSFGLLYEYRLLVVLGLLLTVPPEDRPLWRVASVGAAVLAAVLTFTKLSTGAAALALLGVAAVAWLVRGRVRARDVLIVMTSWIVVTILFGFMLLGGPEGFGDWLGLTVELSSGYVRAMSVQGPTILAVTGLSALGVFAAYLAATARWDRGALLMALSFGGAIFIAFRHAFVRHQGRFIYGFLLALFAVSMLTAVTRRRLVIGAVASALVIPAAAAAAAEPFCSCPWNAQALLPGRGLENLVSVIRLQETERRLVASGHENLEVRQLPRKWRTTIGDGTVDSVPFDLSFVPANGLRWIPNPVLQTYHAFTPELDGWAAGHFLGRDAPQFLVLQYADIDERNPMLAEPATWRAIAARYEPVATATPREGRGPVALLHRRTSPVPIQLRPLTGTTTGAMGRWIDIPPSDDLVLASVELRPDLDGQLAVFLWRYAPLYMDLSYLDGTVRTIRIIPATAEEGMLVNRPPFTLRSFTRLLEGRLPEPAVAFRLHGPGSGSFDSSFGVAWHRIRWAPPG